MIGLRTSTLRAFTLQRSVACLVLAGILALGSSCGTDEATGPFVQPSPTTFPAPYTEPGWHPAARVIVFNHTPLAGRYWNPDAGHLVYVFAESLSGLWGVYSDGSSPRRLTSSYMWGPDWDPSGTSLAYSSGGDIWTVAGGDTGIAEGSAVRWTTIGSAFAPSWRPDGRALAFSVNGGPGAGVYVVESAGGPTRRIGAAGWAFPDWSPRGDSLVFLATQDSRYGVCVTDSGGGGPRMLWGSSEASLGPPRWAPTGTAIAVAGRLRNRDAYQLWILGPDGSSPRPLTQERVQSVVSWSPDGREIAYVRAELTDTTLANGTIWVVDVSSGVKRQVTFNTPLDW